MLRSRSYIAGIVRGASWGVLPAFAYVVYFVLRGGDALLIPVLLVLGLGAAGAQAAFNINQDGGESQDGRRQSRGRER